MSEPKIGVWVCECGGNIGDVVETKKVIENLGDDVSSPLLNATSAANPASTPSERWSKRRDWTGSS